jgi:hypothetical protein
MAIKKDGSLWAWGWNGAGQLGIGSLTDKHTPTEVGGSNWTSVSASMGCTFAIKTDGSLWAWGSNDQGELGTDTTSMLQSSPVRVGTDNNWSSVSSRGYHTVGIRTDCSLGSWGLNSDGQLGNYAYAPRSTSEKMGGSEFMKDFSITIYSVSDLGSPPESPSTSDTPADNATLTIAALALAAVATLIAVWCLIRKK